MNKVYLVYIKKDKDSKFSLEKIFSNEEDARAFLQEISDSVEFGTIECWNLN